MDNGPMSRSVRTWLPILIGALTFVLALVAFGTVAADVTARNIEMRNLVTRIEASEAVMGELQQGVQDIAGSYQDQLPLDDQQQAELDQALTSLAADSGAKLAAAADGVAGVQWLLWHQDIGKAQEAYLAHNRAWQAYLARAAKDPSEFGRQQDLVDSTFAEAEPIIRGAVPIIPMFDLDDRVDEIFAPPALPEGAGQQA